MDLTKCVIGIELGSTRIKAVLLDENNNIIASGGHGWENKFENGIWTYSIEDIHGGIKACYKDLKKDVKEKFGLVVKPCKGNKKFYRDVLIYRSGYKLTELDNAFISKVVKAREKHIEVLRDKS